MGIPFDIITQKSPTPCASGPGVPLHAREMEEEAGKE